MRQAYIPLQEDYEESSKRKNSDLSGVEDADDMPVVGKKSCMAEAYNEEINSRANDSSIVNLLKLLN